MTFVFRNTTLERFFNQETQFSGYSDISNIPKADRYIWAYLQPIGTNNQQIAEEISQYSEMLRLIVGQLPVQKTLIVFTMYSLFNVKSVTNDNDVDVAIEEYNAQVRHLALMHTNIRVVDIADFLCRYPHNELIDWKYYYISQMGINPRLFVDFKAWFQKQLDAIALKRKKCLVLDLDNTIWGGILGEDGINGIQLGGDYPGKAYLFFQKQIKELEQQGVILAICSKNNQIDVDTLWKQHVDCILKKDDFACTKINWQNKADNIREIASELNIGLDSMVFLDDNPTERALIQQELPEVVVPNFPTNPYELPMFFKQIAEQYFAVYHLTEEDKNKTELYRANTLRNHSKIQFANMDEYIKSLQIELTIDEATDIMIPRVAQMTQKTNQFNLTTHRYTEAEIFTLISQGAKIYTLSVRDRFGDNGISGLAIAKIHGDKADIDTFLLSCRVLGKKIEQKFIVQLIEQLKKHGITKIFATYIPTAKNKQVENFYTENGFSIFTQSETKTKYILQ